ncbi:phage tail sheath subtilisin-like domain-containing protein [Bacillus sp. FJAT-45350]|uniref:phage tail sheath subtilisin-like domain-containing protein n=1 Tax=Bacillus sp. FJAT-45350 TaxID=2011014 RepID=UPI000BB732BA|nr:phage tail sheath subtilisin-like domain-containing protein [Bacillus sp. FJAT-45350]
MAGQLFVLGEQKPRPGTYVTWHNAGGTSLATGTVGLAASVLRATWGKVNDVTTITPETMTKLGDNEIIKQIFTGGARVIYAVRGGNGGTVATVDLSGVTIETKYPTSRKFNVTVRESLDGTEKELLLFEGQKQIDKVTFSGDNEKQALADAINEQSNYLLVPSGEFTSGEVDIVLNKEFTDGSDPTMTASDYADTFPTLDTKFFDGICTDTTDMQVHMSLQAYVNRRLNEGSRIIGFVGEKSDIDFETRAQNAKSFNDFAMVYVGNGFLTADEREVEGAEAIARVMGETISGPHTRSMTRHVIQGSVGVVGELTSPQYNEATKSGMLVFSVSRQGLAQIDYGINTKVSLAEIEDEGWKKIRRTRTRFELIDRVVLTLDPRAGDFDNDEDGRQHVITIVNEIIERMPGVSGALIIDPKNPPEGDSAWFKFDNLIDLDSIERFYLDFGFRY